MVLRKRLLNFVLGISVMVFFTSCQAFDREDTGATLEAENQMYSTQGIMIQTEAFLAQTEVVQTVQAAQTEVSQQDGINNQLLATVRAGSTPTIAIVPAPRQQSTGEFGTLNEPVNNGALQFVLTGISSSIFATDGCAVDPQGSFPVGIQRVYATIQAFNIASGTVMAVEWFNGNEVVWSESWTVDQNYDQICIWFFLDPFSVTFTTGVWSAQMSANGTPIQEPMTFAFTGEMDDG